MMDSLKKYYNEKISLHGASPKGVDWNGEESQKIRFHQLLNILRTQRNDFSILDYGCGYGALREEMDNLGYSNFNYHGFDISNKMIESARKKLSQLDNVSFYSNCPEETFDFVVSSGVFSVKLNMTNEDWKSHIFSEIKKLHQLSNKGFAFNCLTKYSDKPLMKDHLYYADPLEMFDFCKVNFSRNVALLHDYDLYEFTILVKK